MVNRNQADKAVQKRLLEGMAYELIPLKNPVSYTHLTLPTILLV